MARKSFLISLFVMLATMGQNLGVNGFKQEMSLYFQSNFTGDFLYFENNQPDLRRYRDLFPLVKGACMTGWWADYRDTNYNGLEEKLGGSFNSEDRDCKTLNGTSMKSVRHFGASDTGTNAFSLYSKTNFEGTELLVQGRAYAGITSKISSFSASGRFDWKLFEGQHLDGNSVCVVVPKFSGYNFNFENNVTSSLNLTTIGSIFRGCSTFDIQEFRKTKVVSGVEAATS